jgi:hypothetical protein
MMAFLYAVALFIYFIAAILFTEGIIARNCFGLDEQGVDILPKPGSHAEGSHSGILSNPHLEISGLPNISAERNPVVRRLSSSARAPRCMLAGMKDLRYISASRPGNLKQKKRITLITTSPTSKRAIEQSILCHSQRQGRK